MIPQSLQAFFRQNPRGALAFSGGVDSALLVWAAARVVMTGVAGEPFTWQIFLAGALLNAIPGIILQLIFIPAVMVALDRTGMVRFRRRDKAARAAGT